MIEQHKSCAMRMVTRKCHVIRRCCQVEMGREIEPDAETSLRPRKVLRKQGGGCFF
jgi:hypothetical protein